MKSINFLSRLGLALACLLIFSACQSALDEASQVTSEEPTPSPTLTATLEVTEMQPTATVGSRPQFEGTIAFYSDMAGNPDIYIIQADGTGLTQLTDDAAFDDSPDLSPSGTRVVFLSARNDPDPQFPDFKYDIYVVNCDGTGLTQLTATEAGEDHPSWSPDESRILFDADYDGDRFYEMYSMAADGTDLVRLTTGAHNDQFGEYSPDGSQIAFSSDRNGDWDIFTMDADGSNQAILEVDQTWQIFPTWSPDGEWIAFVQMVPGSGETNVFSVSSDGTNLRQETWGSGYNENPTFSSDGQWIAYQTNMDGDFEIYVKAFHSNDPAFHFFTFPSDELWPSWGPISISSD
ncbi:PD40 domain-containing protein [Chloroflexota bacterium]|nr:PD40 domain-containing protein [Chloroflexota bacterium]